LTTFTPHCGRSYSHYYTFNLDVYNQVYSGVLNQSNLM